jgi:thiol-disulfide isomerase/thioredoxin
MKFTKALYLFLIILFIVILIIVIFKSIVPLIGAGIEIKGYIGNLKGNFDIEISKNNDKTSSPQKYEISEHEENNHYNILSQNSYIPTEHKEQNNHYNISSQNSYTPSEHEEDNNQYKVSSQNSYIPSEHEENNHYNILSQNSYIPSEHEENNQLLQNGDDDSNIDEYLNIIEEDVNDDLIFNSYIPLTKLNDYNTELSNMHLDEEDIIESFDSIDGYDNPVFVMFYAPWCTFSKNSLPDFQKLSQTYQGKINIALVNCEDEKDVAIKHKVQQYPTIRYYPNGMNVPQYVDYNQGSNYNSYIKYLKLVTDTII